MEFALDFLLLALIMIGLVAFMGVISTKVAEFMGKRKGKKSYDMNEITKQGWKNVGGNK